MFISIHFIHLYSLDISGLSYSTIILCSILHTLLCVYIYTFYTSVLSGHLWTIIFNHYIVQHITYITMCLYLYILYICTLWTSLDYHIQPIYCVAYYIHYYVFISIHFIHLYSLDISGLSYSTIILCSKLHTLLCVYIYTFLYICTLWTSLDYHIQPLYCVAYYIHYYVFISIHFIHLYSLDISGLSYSTIILCSILHTLLCVYIYTFYTSVLSGHLWTIIFNHYIVQHITYITMCTLWTSLDYHIQPLYCVAYYIHYYVFISIHFIHLYSLDISGLSYSTIILCSILHTLLCVYIYTFYTSVLSGHLWTIIFNHYIV